ncbi:unnamed protein product [Rotaria sp. Silwood2]|nr:unnamed protein product [Rotaria sp. Silwood2]
MTSIQKNGLSFDRIRGPIGFNVDHLKCPICHELLWKPVACQSCETPFCSTCIHQWLVNHPKNCPNRCKTYIERKCPPVVAKLLAELKIVCFYESTGCNEVISYEGLDKHEIECSFQSHLCPGCQSQILKKDFDNHQNNCASIELTCQDCALVYKRGNADRQHTEVICLREQLRQFREESKENKREINQLNLQLNEMRILNPSTTKMRITFDDLPIGADRSQLIPNIYSGFKWANIGYGNELFWKIKCPKSGYATSFIAGGSRNIAFFKDFGSIGVENPKKTINFVSVTACAAWNDDLHLIITGYRNFIEVNRNTTTLLFGKPELILLHWKDIDKITLKSYGGTAHSTNDRATGSQVVLTQFAISQVDGNK